MKCILVRNRPAQPRACKSFFLDYIAQFPGDGKGGSGEGSPKKMSFPRVDADQGLVQRSNKRPDWVFLFPVRDGFNGLTPNQRNWKTTQRERRAVGNDTS